MLRFVDLRDQIVDIEDAPIAFAFYDTVRDQFIDLVGHGPVYTSLKDFEEELGRSDESARRDGREPRFEKDRFMSLLPPWVRGGPPTPWEQGYRIVDELIGLAKNLADSPHIRDLDELEFSRGITGFKDVMKKFVELENCLMEAYRYRRREAGRNTD